MTFEDFVVEIQRLLAEEAAERQGVVNKIAAANRARVRAEYQLDEVAAWTRTLRQDLHDLEAILGFDRCPAPGSTSALNP